MFIIRLTTQEILNSDTGFLSLHVQTSCYDSIPEMSSSYFIESITLVGGGQIGLTSYETILLLLLFAAVLMDFLYDKILNGWIIIGILIGLLCRILENGWSAVFGAGVTIFLSLCLLYPLYKIGALGAGDVKLFFLTGSFATVKWQLSCIVISFFIGGLFSVWKMISEENFKERMQYLFSYLFEVFCTRQWRLYGENLKQDSDCYKSNKIHFALPVCISAMLGLGGLF